MILAVLNGRSFEGLATALIVGLASFGALYVFRGIGNTVKADTSKFYNVAEFTDTSFKTSPFYIAVSASFIIVGALGCLALIIYKPNGWDDFFMFFAAIAMVAGIAGVYADLRRRVTVVGHEIVYVSLFDTFRIDLRNIRYVYVFYGNACIEMKSGEKHVIPLLFRHSGKLLAMLNYYRP